MQKSHRRSTKVCTRCRQRKTKCDFKFPQCTSCKGANATCMGFDPATRKSVPRSLVKSLEARVAELETQLLDFRAAPRNFPYLMASKVAQATISFGVPITGSFLHSKISPALFFRPSCPPLAVSATALDRDPTTDGPEHPESPPGKEHSDQPEKPYTSNPVNLKMVPVSAFERMVRNYADILLPQYPCIPESLLESIVNRSLDDLGESQSLLTYGITSASGFGHFEYFVLFIVLAISAITLTWRAEDQARAASESFYRSALKHLQVLENYSEIKALQISLLLAHYAHLCPERVDNWTCIANAIRIVLSLGLHRECHEGLDDDQARLRSELFWVAYGMERSLCVNLRLPLSFPEEAITAKLQDPTPDESNFLFIADETRKKSSANHICRYRALETEVHRVLYLEEDLGKFNAASFENWILDITARLEGWYHEAQGYTEYNMLEFKHVQFHHLKARIHRPTPRLKVKGPADWEVVLGASQHLIEDYLGQERRRRLFYPWHGAHILFETAIIALHASWSSRDFQPLREQARRMSQVLIPQCLQLLTSIGQRWNEATRCADKLRPLAQKISDAFAWAEDLPVYDDASITEELHSLLFSDKSLTWNEAPIGDIDFNFEDGSLLFDNILNDIDFFQWAPEWDIVSSETA
ncbi:hypothetical protein GQ53DRAFT_845580 [Thozetella sp. PMI_491]|nr:hypothetical protein GQ53DRAFT_845580 [Thozetella sp. PMI_491]